MKNLLVGLLLTVLSTAAWAHSKVDKTLPENGSVVAEVPENLAMTFAKKIRLIKVELTAKEGEAMTLDLGSQTKFATEFEIPLPDAGTGLYQIDWRGLGTDGHAMTGQFEFTVE